jgi:hypothetical protein
LYGNTCNETSLIRRITSARIYRGPKLLPAPVAHTGCFYGNHITGYFFNFTIFSSCFTFTYDFMHQRLLKEPGVISAVSFILLKLIAFHSEPFSQGTPKQFVK